MAWYHGISIGLSGATETAVPQAHQPCLQKMLSREVPARCSPGPQVHCQTHRDLEALDGILNEPVVGAMIPSWQLILITAAHIYCYKLNCSQQVVALPTPIIRWQIHKKSRAHYKDNDILWKRLVNNECLYTFLLCLFDCLNFLTNFWKLQTQKNNLCKK